jgi:hypothetical protein
MDAHARFGDHHEVVVDLVTVFGEEVGQDADDILWSLVVEAEKDDSAMRMAITKDEIAEAFVGRDEDTILTRCPREDILVDRAARGLEDRDNVMLLRAQSAADDWTEAFVDDTAHLGG